MAMGTALAVGSAASSAIGAGMSFAQAARNRKLQLEAEAAAEQALNDAKKKLEVNYYDQLSLPMQAYELERDAIMATAAQAIEAGRESERGGVATAGRIQMAAQDAQRKQAADTEQQLMELEKLSATEDSRLAGKMSEILLAESTGAQQAAADYQNMAAKSMQAGFGALTQGLGTALGREDFFALYGKVNRDGGEALTLNTLEPKLIPSTGGSSLQRNAPSMQGLMPSAAPVSTGVQRQPIVTFGPQGNVLNYNPNAIPFDYNSNPPAMNPFDYNAVLPYLNYLRR